MHMSAGCWACLTTNRLIQKIMQLREFPLRTHAGLCH